MFDFGVDDYVIKFFDIEEVLVCICIVLCYWLVSEV